MDDDELVRPLSGSDWWNVPASGDVPALCASPTARAGRAASGSPAARRRCASRAARPWARPGTSSSSSASGAALAEETRAKGAQVLLGPTINLQRTPLGGRHFECFSEDPYLTARLASAYVRGLQGGGVAACVKHLVANDQEEDRFEISSEPDERTLREVSLLPFEHALRSAGAWSTMAAYNRLHGTHCSANERLLTTILRDEWGWDGVVISDWFAVHTTAESANAGLDLEMPGPPLHWGSKLAAAVGAGEVGARRDRGQAGAPRPPRPAHRRRRASPPGDEAAGGGGDAVAVAREAAAASLVLLRNDGRAAAARVDAGSRSSAPTATARSSRAAAAPA